MFDAPCSYQEIDRLANGDAATAERAKIARSGDCDRLSGHWFNLEAAEKGFNLVRRPFIVEALQHFAKHQVANDDLVGTENFPQCLDVSSPSASEEVDPNTAVDNDQSVPRPLRP